jgi:hypothetical protein
MLFYLEIYLIACLIDYFSTAATYVEYVGFMNDEELIEFLLEIEQLSNLGKIFFHFELFLMMFEIQLIVFI